MTPGKVNGATASASSDVSSLVDSSEFVTADSTIKDELGVLSNSCSYDNGKSDEIKTDCDSVEDGKIKDERLKQENNGEVLLGSLTLTSSPAVRTSARVIQKMKMDSIRPTTPPPSEKKEGVKDEHSAHSRTNAQKTPNQTRPSKTIWSNIERNLFFDALNECGKDFEAIAQYINVKQKRKNATDPTYKTKDHVRLLYYQTFSKISKYLRFSDDVTKKIQELYALINYGEMRRKVPLDNQKLYMKLRELVYRGSVTVRVKGKNCRIKTPSCPALRKINQVEKWQEDIKLPTKVNVEFKPTDDKSWYFVQSLAQNPRVKTSLPLQKRLISLIKTLQLKWRTKEARMLEQNAMKPELGEPASSSGITGTAHVHSNAGQSETLLCILPPKDAVIHRPYINLTDFLTSYSICLNSYEERIDATVRGESLCAEYMNNYKETAKSNTKRQRHDSGSEKKSPDAKRNRSGESETKSSPEEANKRIDDGTEDHLGSMVDEKPLELDFASPTHENTMFEIEGITQIVECLSADEGDRDDKIVEDTKSGPSNSSDESSATDFVAVDAKKESTDGSAEQLDCLKRVPSKNKRSDTKKREARARENFRPLIADDVIQKIRRGWTMHDVGDITVGDLYLMFGQDSVVRLEYKWITIENKSIEANGTSDSAEGTEGPDRIVIGDEVKREQENEVDDIKTANDEETKPKNVLSNRLKQLLLLASMTEKTRRKPNCSCGHYCDRNPNKIKKEEGPARSFVSNKTYPSSMMDNGVFRQPVLPSRSGVDAYRLNMNNSRNRWLKSRNNRSTKQLVVQRVLLQPSVTQSGDTMNSAQVNETIELSLIAGPSSTMTSSEQPMPSMIDLTDDFNVHHIEDEIDEEKSEEEISEPKMAETIHEELNAIDEIDGDEDEDVDDLRERINNDPGIQSLMEISLPSPLPIVPRDDCFSDSMSQPPMSPMRILREMPSPADSKWFEENMQDFSLSSFLGHLDQSCDHPNTPRRSRSPNRNNESSNISTISETSIDYISKFEELAESMKNDANNALLQ